METPLYDSMNWHTKKRFLRRPHGYGKPLPYRPHGLLIKNLSKKFGIPADVVLERLKKERTFLLRQIGVK